MATGSAIFNVPQTYGNGLVTVQGVFTDNSGTITIAHGKGWTVARSGTTGIYKLVLTAGAKGLHWGDCNIGAPASQTTTAYSHPGFGLCGDLQSDGVTMYLYTYNSSAVGAWPGSSTTPVQFRLMLSMSNLNP